MIISLEEINPFMVKTHRVAPKTEQMTYVKASITLFQDVIKGKNGHFCKCNV